MGDFCQLLTYDAKSEMSVVGRLMMFFHAGCQKKSICLTMMVFYKHRVESWI